MAKDLKSFVRFVAEAIEKYPFDIANGDELMDHLEEALRQVRSRTGPAKEYFGYHYFNILRFLVRYSIFRYSACALCNSRCSTTWS